MVVVSVFSVFVFVVVCLVGFQSFDRVFWCGFAYDFDFGLCVFWLVVLWAWGLRALRRAYEFCLVLLVRILWVCGWFVL